MKLELSSFLPVFPQPCREFNSRSLSFNVLRDGLKIQEVTPVVSMATVRSAVLGRRPLLKHKEPRGLDQHKQPSLHTHTHTDEDKQEKHKLH